MDNRYTPYLIGAACAAVMMVNGAIRGDALPVILMTGVVAFAVAFLVNFVVDKMFSKREASKQNDIYKHTKKDVRKKLK